MTLRRTYAFRLYVSLALVSACSDPGGPSEDSSDPQPVLAACSPGEESGGLLGGLFDDVFGDTCSSSGSTSDDDSFGGLGQTCETLPETDNYDAPGPFDATMISGTGPDGNYTLFRPDSTLGQNGFKHPVATWGNGILTTPDQYFQTLTLIASHGFVIIACNDIVAERPCLSDGMDWLIQQNTAAGDLQGKLDTTREVTIGYSWGGGAAIDAANRPNVKATVSIHGMPPRELTAFLDMHSPLLLFTSTGDTFVTADGFVTPNYDQSLVQTFYATLDDLSVDHLYIVDDDAVSCVASVALGDCGSARQQRAPAIAWLRYWACGDQNARKYFFDDDCVLCRSPWSGQRKNWPLF